jgi:hypothetical protein
MVVGYSNDTGAGTGNARLQVQIGSTTKSVALVGTGTPGGLRIGLDGHVISDPAIAAITTTPSSPIGGQTFIVVNASLADIGPLTLTIENATGVGTFAIALGAECDGATLDIGGHSGCALMVTYTNASGAGDANATLLVSAPTSTVTAQLIGHGRSS